MYHYTYMIKANDKFYIGARSCDVLPEEDSYFSSCKTLLAWIKNNGVTGLVKEIISVFPTRALAIEHEIELHNFYDVAANKLFWNKAKQTAVGFDTAGTEQNEELRLRKSLKTKGLQKSEEHKEKIRLAHLGKKKTKEHCLALSKAKAGTPCHENTRNAASKKWKGVPKTEEQKLKMSIAAKARWVKIKENN